MSSTPTPTPTFAPPSIDVGSAAGSPGEQVAFDLKLRTGGDPFAAAQNDIEFDNAAVIIPERRVCNAAQDRECSTDMDCGDADTCVESPDCTVNPAIAKEATSFSFLPVGCEGAACAGVRTRVYSIDDPDLGIPDGATLYTCRLRISRTAVAGSYALTTSNTSLRRANSAQFIPDVQGHPGSIVVSGEPVTLTPTSTFTASPTVGPDFCCECGGTPPVCGPPIDGSCSSCTTVNGASCGGTTGQCMTFTPTPTDTPTETPTPTATDQPTETPTLTPTATTSHTGTPTFTASATSTASTAFTASPTATVLPCGGDCDTSGKVTVDEILTLVNIALTGADASTCEAGDISHDGKITVDEILTAVNSALTNCASPA